MELIPRHASLAVSRLLDVFRIVVVTGARQVGKSTLARLVGESRSATYLTLDDPLTLSEATGDPDGFVSTSRGMTVIDEVQRLPDLLRAVKLAVDRDPSPGRFLLTGSANLLGMRAVTESLAGRAAYLELLPLSWSEINRMPVPRSLDAAFSAASAEEFAASLLLVQQDVAEEVRHRVLSGGMPEAHRLDADSRRIWYESYRKTFLEGDLRQLSDISSIPEFGRVLSLALLRTGGLLNKSDIAADAQVSHSTVDRYLGLLQVAYQVRLLSPFFANLAKRLVKSPKLYAVDVGAAAWAANAYDWRAVVAAAKEGPLLETFVLSDVIAWDGLAGASRYHFWRTGAGAEVDLLVERGEKVVAVEVKGTAKLTGRDLSGLRALRQDLGDRLQLGILAYLGTEARVVDRHLVAVPLASFLGAG